AVCAPLPSRERGWGEGVHAIRYFPLMALVLCFARAGMHRIECYVRAPSPQPSPTRGEGAQSRGNIRGWGSDAMRIPIAGPSLERALKGRSHDRYRPKLARMPVVGQGLGRGVAAFLFRSSTARWAAAANKNGAALRSPVRINAFYSRLPASAISRFSKLTKML